MSYFVSEGVQVSKQISMLIVGYFVERIKVGEGYYKPYMLPALSVQHLTLSEVHNSNHPLLQWFPIERQEGNEVLYSSTGGCMCNET